MKIEPYFGMSRRMYLQTLCNRFGDFGVSWNWFNHDTQTWEFTKRRGVMELWHDDPSRLDKVQHRQAMPGELFIELDDPEPHIAYIKMRNAVAYCKEQHAPYCVYKSRKGYHISAFFGKLSEQKRRDILTLLQSDMQFVSKRVTWSLEWSSHWKQPDFIIHHIEISPRYTQQLLGYDVTTN